MLIWPAGHFTVLYFPLYFLYPLYPLVFLLLLVSPVQIYSRQKCLHALGKSCAMSGDGRTIITSKLSLTDEGWTTPSMSLDPTRHISGKNMFTDFQQIFYNSSFKIKQCYWLSGSAKWIVTMPGTMIRVWNHKKTFCNVKYGGGGAAKTRSMQEAERWKRGRMTRGDIHLLSDIWYLVSQTNKQMQKLKINAKTGFHFSHPLLILFSCCFRFCISKLKKKGKSSVVRW